MEISRRCFLDLCKGGAAALGFGSAYLSQLERALANPAGPAVVWLVGSSCSGCSISFLNRISSTAPATAGDVLIQTINLKYHPTLMAASGQTAAAAAESVAAQGGHILVVEGAVPTAFGGAACWAWTYNGVEVTFKDAVTKLAAKASQVVCVGTCASFGGVGAAPPNPTGLRSVKAATLKNTLNIPGCPPHPDWVVWAIANLITRTVGSVDSYGRPLALYGSTVHSRCPRKETEEADTYGIDRECLKEIGCMGPKTKANCPTLKWNNAVNWCVDANAQCIACTEPTFAMSALRRTHGDD